MTLHVGDEKRADKLLEGYVLESPEVVHRIAARSDTVVETLHEMRGMIAKYFGPETPAELALEPDPEIPGYVPIVVQIRTPREMTDSFERLKKFDEEWWLDVARNEPEEIIVLPVGR